MKNFVKNYLTKAGVDIGIEGIKSLSAQLWYSIDMTSFAWNWSTIGEVFTNIPNAAGYSPNAASDTFSRTSSKQPSILSYAGKSDKNKMYCKIYHKVPIFLEIAGGDSPSTGNNVFLKTFNIKFMIKTLQEFVVKCSKYQAKVQEKEWRTSSGKNHPGTGNFQITQVNIKRRTFDDVFIKEADKALIKKTLDAFINNKQWYIDNNIPHHIGILLYGKPGTGKSVIAQAISDYIGARLLILNGDDITHLNSSLDHASYKPNEKCYTVLLVEDVDCGFTSRGFSYNIHRRDDNRPNEEENKSGGLATILNCIDGFGSPDNVVYIFTTNNIDSLDPALIRPGRMDIKIEIDYVTEETFRQYVKYHYGEEINYPVTINRNLTFAELQTYTMRGYTVTQLIDLLGGCNNDDSEDGGDTTASKSKVSNNKGDV